MFYFFKKIDELISSLKRIGEAPQQPREEIKSPALKFKKKKKDTWET